MADEAEVNAANRSDNTMPPEEPPTGDGNAVDRQTGDEASAADAPAGEQAGEDSAAVDDLDAVAQAMEVDLEALLAEREQFLEAYRRVQADFENYRKQTQKRLDAAVDRQLGGFVERLLPVLDACDAAGSQGAAEAAEPIMTALYGALEKEGLERIDPKGELFDPEAAEAVLHEPGDGRAQVVTEVMRPGYRWQGRLLRPALVKVTE